MKLRTFTLSLIGLIAAFALPAVNADTPGRHPAYLRARSDLRRAQFLLRVREEPNVTRRLIEADHEVEAAVVEIDRAAVIDHKDLEEHPRVDTNFDRRGRFRRIVELMRSARADLGREEDNAALAAGAMRRTGTSMKRSNTCIGHLSICTGTGELGF